MSRVTDYYDKVSSFSTTVLETTQKTGVQQGSKATAKSYVTSCHVLSLSSCLFFFSFNVLAATCGSDMHSAGTWWHPMVAMIPTLHSKVEGATHSYYAGMQACTL